MLFCFHSPLIKPDVQFSRIRLSDKMVHVSPTRVCSSLRLGMQRPYHLLLRDGIWYRLHLDCEASPKFLGAWQPECGALASDTGASVFKCERFYPEMEWRSTASGRMSLETF